MKALLNLVFGALLVSGVHAAPFEKGDPSTKPKRHSSWLHASPVAMPIRARAGSPRMKRTWPPISTSSITNLNKGNTTWST